MAYTIQQKIGQGSQGSVYKAEWNDLDTPSISVAIKRVPKPHTQREKERVENEVTILSKMPKTVPITIHLKDSFTEPTSRCIVTDYVDGEVMKIQKQNERQVKHILRNILRFVSICHANGIAHRDIKPANFMISKDGAVKGIDFGMSCLVDSRGMCSGGVGTPLYMAPESILFPHTEKEIHGFSADMWSVGVIGYQFLTGKHPYDSILLEQPEDFLPKMKQIPFDAPEVSQQAWPLLRKLLSFEPDKRPSAFEALQDPWLAEDDTYKNASFFLYLEHV